MRLIKIFILAMFGIALSAYRNYTKPHTLYQYHAQKIESSDLVNDNFMTPFTDEERLGKGLFKANCASCHNKNMTDKLLGPALGSTEQNWEGYPRYDLYNWIRNSQGLIDEKHPRAEELWKEWSPEVMPAMPHLNESDIEAILAYIRKISRPDEAK